MVKPAALASQLESIVGADGVAGEPSDFAVDGLTPRAAVAPSSYEQVAEVMRFASAEGLAVIPWGGGSHLHIGNVPSRYDLALSLSRLDQVVEHEPADLTLTCQAGIALTDLQAHLARQGQLVSLGSMQAGSPTAGGILAANASGPSRHAYGSPRDFTIGMRVVTADGRLTRAGGRVVKNVAGYDLCKLYIGSLGTLGVIVEATFKVMPLPKEERTVIAGFSTAAGACEFAASLQRRGLALRAVQLLSPAATTAAGGLRPAGPFSLVVELAGTHQAVDRSRREVGELAAGAAGDLREASDAPGVFLLDQSAAALACRATTLPTRLPALVEALEQLQPAPSTVALPTVGVLHASWPEIEDAEEVVRRLRSTVGEGGALVLERGPPDLKRRLDVFGGPPPSFDLMRRIKQQFDPRGILSPGRYLGGL